MKINLANSNNQEIRLYNIAYISNRQFCRIPWVELLSQSAPISYVLKRSFCPKLSSLMWSIAHVTQFLTSSFEVLPTAVSPYSPERNQVRADWFCWSVNLLDRLNLCTAKWENVKFNSNGGEFWINRRRIFRRWDKAIKFKRRNTTWCSW